VYSVADDIQLVEEPYHLGAKHEIGQLQFWPASLAAV
jgi:hypothetical protein